MEFLGTTLKKHLANGAYAVALVCSLVVYQRTVVDKPISIGQKYQRANSVSTRSIAAIPSHQVEPDKVKKPILKQSSSALGEVYQGSSRYPAWEEFLSHYQIKDLQVRRQRLHGGAVQTKFTIAASSHQGAVVVLSVSIPVAHQLDL